MELGDLGPGISYFLIAFHKCHHSYSVSGNRMHIPTRKNEEDQVADEVT